jgi:hypothetical protein
MLSGSAGSAIMTWHATKRSAGAEYEAQEGLQ